MSIGTGGTVIRTEILGANNRLRMVMVRSRKYDVADRVPHPSRLRVRVLTFYTCFRLVLISPFQ